MESWTAAGKKFSTFRSVNEKSTRTIFVICGSASDNSSNHKLIDKFVKLAGAGFKVTIYNDLKLLPHFDPKQASENPPKEIREFRNSIEHSDAVLICTPEYIFSIPSGLKNAIEWCVSTTVFTNKPVGIITASLDGEKGHEELKLIMRTVQARFTDETTLLIKFIKGRINDRGEIVDQETARALAEFTRSFSELIKSPTFQP